jgi:hypothetical protein
VRWPTLGLLADEPMHLAVGAMNLVPAPCAPCGGMTLAQCAQDPPAGCENVEQLVARAARMSLGGSDLDHVRDALSYQDDWIGPLDLGPPRAGAAEPLAGLVVWLDPLGSLTPPALETARALLDGHPGVLAVAWRFRVDPDDPASLAVAAIGTTAGDRLPAWLDAAATERTALRGEDADARQAALARAAEAAGITLPSTEQQRRAEAEAVRQSTAGEAVGVRSAPTWFVDGYRLRGAQSLPAIDDLLDRQLDDAVAAAP